MKTFRMEHALPVDTTIPDPSLVGCPHDDACEGQAWAPACNITDLARALSGELMYDPDVHCTAHGPHHNNAAPDADSPRCTVPQAPYTEAARA
ncbi:hypothetical protein [Streptomyces albus]|uniref:hypothetical protein n=1 Tax=Streptomyces albus TaxID=1888 RepID=UPI0033D05682